MIHKGGQAMVFPESDNNIIVEFDKPVSAITPGQAAVLYCDENNDSRLVGGAWIDEVRK